MVKKIFINEIGNRENIETTFLVKYLNVMNSRDGKNYLNIILCDRDGDLEARKWHGAEDVTAVVSKGDYVKVSGKINNFQGRNQLIISQINRIDESEVIRSDYVIQGEMQSSEMKMKLNNIIESIDDYYLKTLVNNVLNRADVKDSLLKWSAAKTIHHAYEGGLLEHTLSCANLALVLSEKYKVNKSYVLAGVILHDLAKIFELTDGPIVEYTDEGKLIGHLAQIVEIIDREMFLISDFPADVKMHLKHIILSHHGELLYGSPKVPQTSEALLVHLVDLMDSKMHSFELAKRIDNQPGNWTGFVKHLDRIIYKKPLPTYLSKHVESPTKKLKVADVKQPTGAMAKLLKDVIVDD